SPSSSSPAPSSGNASPPLATIRPESPRHTRPHRRSRPDLRPRLRRSRVNGGMIMPAWLFGYFLLGGGLYWGLQTFMPHAAAGWTAAVVTVAAWFFMRRLRKQAEAEAWVKQQVKEPAA